MGFYGWQAKEPSEKSRPFSEGQEVSFIYRKEMRVGIVEALRVNSAVIILKALTTQKNVERTVVNYDNLVSVFE